MSVVIETTIGDITVDLYLKERPQTSKNFLKLCKLKYYNHCSFHFVQRDFIAQSGDPTGTGTGGESAYYQVKGSAGRFIEAEKKPKLKHDRFGLISMVNNGENSHGSQFFFTLCHSLNYLDAMHTVFGEVVEGQDILVKLNDTICDEHHRPYQDILITHTIVLDDPFPEIEGLQLPDHSPEYNFEEILKSDRIGVGEDLVDDDKPPEEIEEELKDKDARQRALVLEMIGDIPDAEIAPPENVLFVCKLNPVTREEDLEIIFSRFGRIVSCEIIKDDKTGDSLQYAFIEFEKQEDCEKAYFKMDNVLIDERRIHVDFSQSVSKLKWRGKGRGVTYINESSEQYSNKDSEHFNRKSMNYVKMIGQSKQKDHGFERNERRPAAPLAPPKVHRDNRTKLFHHQDRHHRSRSRSPNKKRDWQNSSRSHHRRHHSRSRSPPSKQSHRSNRERTERRQSPSFGGRNLQRHSRNERDHHHQREHYHRTSSSSSSSNSRHHR